MKTKKELERENELLRKALVFTMEHHATPVIISPQDALLWTGECCGCCSDAIKLPEDIEPIMSEVARGMRANGSGFSISIISSKGDNG